MNRQLMLASKGKPSQEPIVFDEKSRELQILEKEYSELELILKQRNSTHQQNKIMLEKTLAEIQERRIELLNLQSRIGGTEYNINRERELRRELQELSDEITKLHSNIAELLSSPFVKRVEGRQNYVKKLKQRETEIEELEKAHAALIEEAETNEFENKQLADEAQRLKDEIKQLKATIEELKSGFSKATASRLLSAKTTEEFRQIMETMVQEGTLPEIGRAHV